MQPYGDPAERGGFPPPRPAVPLVAPAHAGKRALHEGTVHLGGVQKEGDPLPCTAAGSGQDHVELLVAHESGAGGADLLHDGAASAGVHVRRAGVLYGHSVHALCLYPGHDLRRSRGGVSDAPDGDALPRRRAAAGAGDHRGVSGAGIQ